MNDRVYYGGMERLRDPARLELLEIDRVVDLSIKQLTVKSMLDVGTGTGVFAAAFAGRNIDVSGIDISESMLVEARRIVPAGKFTTGNMEKIPFEDSSFDIAFLGLLLHEADDLGVALLESARVAKSRVVVLEWPYAVGEKGPPLDHRLKSAEVISKAALVGFENVQIIQFSRVPSSY